MPETLYGVALKEGNFPDSTVDGRTHKDRDVNAIGISSSQFGKEEIF